MTSTKTLSGTNRKTTRFEFFCETYKIKSTFRQMLILYHMIAIPLSALNNQKSLDVITWYGFILLHIQRPFCYPLSPDVLEPISNPLDGGLSYINSRGTNQTFLFSNCYITCINFGLEICAWTGQPERHRCVQIIRKYSRTGTSFYHWPHPRKLRDP